MHQPAVKLTLLVADHPATRAGIRIALGGAAEVCAEASDTQQAIADAEREQPDVCLVGLDIPGGGVTAVRGICEVAPKPTERLTLTDQIEELREALTELRAAGDSSESALLALGFVLPPKR